MVGFVLCIIGALLCVLGTEETVLLFGTEVVIGNVVTVRKCSEPSISRTLISQRTLLYHRIYFEYISLF